MLKTICQILVFACMIMMSDKEASGQEYCTCVTDVIEMREVLHQDWLAIYGENVADVTDAETLSEAQEKLAMLPEDCAGIFIENGELSTEELAEAFWRCWQHCRKDRYALSVAYAGEDEKGKDVMMPFAALMEEDCMMKLEAALTQKGSFPNYIRLERLNGLDIYTFRIRIPGQRYHEDEYSVILNGTWEGREVCWQYVAFPTTEIAIDYWYYDRYSTIRADINYDGCADLFIREGYSWGSGGSWVNCRGIIWRADLGKFVWYESLPEQIDSIELEKKRLIDHYNLGAFEEHVIEYKVVGGEYREVRELAWIDETLSYYEMGVLVKEYDTTDMKYDEVCALYPDLDYWWEG